MLYRKMLRDIKNNLSQFITIFLMVLIGVMAYSGIESYMNGMQETANTFYSENNLFDLQLLGNNFTEEDLTKVKEIKNVKNAERKLSVTASSDNDTTLLLNFIESNEISRFYIVKGTKFDVNKKGVWLDEFYAKENNIKLGDTITIKYDDLVLKEEVLGLINVPDHLYDTKDESELYPNRKEFGFAYLSINELSEDYIKSKVMKEMSISDEKYLNNFNYKDYLIFNYLMVDVDDTNNIEQVKNDIEDNIDNALAIINREDIASYRTYQGEVDEGKTYVGIFSGLFIFIALLSVVTTMTRVVKNERTQIGILKSLGFTNFKILMHYIGYGFWISLFGSIAGLICGYFILGSFFIEMEMSFFEIPNGHPVMNNSSYLVAILVIVLVSIATYFTGRKILKENPAETLRSKVPSFKKGSLDITRKGLFKKLSFSTKWNLRDILRNKTRTILGIVGVTASAMLIVCALGMLDSMNHFIKLQFEDLYNFDYKLTLNTNITSTDYDNLLKEYGNATSQTLGIEIKKDGVRESNNIIVTDAKDKLRFVNGKGYFIKVDSDSGIYITRKLASNNNYKIGDNITWHIYGDDTYYTSKIVGFNKDPQNQNVTMTRSYLESLGLTYKADSLYTDKDLSKVKEIKGVDLIQNINNLKDSMNNMLSTMKSMISIIIVIACLLGSVIIYNLGILSYTEKQYQFATLKVLGFDNNKIRKIFVKQNNWIAIISIILGLPLGYYLTEFLFQEAIEASYDFNAYIRPITYLISAIGTYLVSSVVSRILSRKVKNIDMVSSLKGNE